MLDVKHKKLFGTDGVRGCANLPPIEIETALLLGRALGLMLSQKGGKHRVVIGKDTRLSCYMYENALVAGLCSMGVDTLMVGPLPTPGVAFITKAYRADAGIVISASHNPYKDNGIKFFDAEGFKFPRHFEETLEEFVFENAFQKFLPKDDAIGRNTRIHDADGRYIEFVKATFPKALSLKGVSIVLDSANGAGYRVAPQIFWELEAQVVSVGNKPNGLNINENCGALHLDLIKSQVLEQKADIGIALDGDADRVILIDETGDVVDGDQILAICALDLKSKGLLKNNLVVGTVMTNYGVIQTLKEANIDVSLSQVGDRYVIQKMIESGACLGGEQSGHLIFLDHITTGDGLVSALQILRIMKEKNLPLSTLKKQIKQFPQLLLNVPVLSKPPLENLDRLQKELHLCQKELASSGRILVRYSGTEAVCRVMCEGVDPSLNSRLAKRLAKVIEEELGS
jgi:phosphoglucosamine mutase